MRAINRICGALVFALATGAFVLAPTAGAQNEGAKRVQVINLTTKTAQESPEPTSFAVGTSFASSDDVFRGGRRVGVLGAVCSVVRIEPSPLPAGQEPTSATVHCVASLQLAQGQLTLQGLVTFSEQAGPRFTVAITGGTGAFRTARGEATITENADENGPDRLRLRIIR